MPGPEPHRSIVLNLRCRTPPAAGETTHLGMSYRQTQLASPTPWTRIVTLLSRSLSVLGLLLAAPGSSLAQQIHFPAGAAQDSALLATSVPRAARQLLGLRTHPDTVRALSDQLRLHLAVGDAAAAQTSIAAIRRRSDAPTPDRDPALVVLETVANSLAERRSFGDAFRARFQRLSDREAYEVAWYLETPPFVFARNLNASLSRTSASDSLSVADAVALVRNYVLDRALSTVRDSLDALIAADRARRYDTDTSVTIRTRDGATLSAVVMRPRALSGRAPTILNYTIYTDIDTHQQVARVAASHGYVGVVADARGKRLSGDSIRPFETEAEDTHAVLDWIAAQPWSDGRVGMYGNSYEGFSAWAAAKRAHPALRTIVASAASIPGLGLPMENNVFLTANYAWPFFVGNSRELDHDTYGDRERWGNLPTKWFESGRPFREIDQVDGTANPMLQRWLRHPAYDEYWQRMVPYGADFAQIDIPVLSISGYFDDAQVSAIEYVKQHHHFRPNAEHYFVIGPYDHFSASAARKPPVLREYAIDPVAQFSGTALTFEWFDFVFKSGPRPAMLRDRINFQVMGANEWRHARDFASLTPERRTYFLGAARTGEPRPLLSTPPAGSVVATRVADLSDRKREHHSYYPEEVIGDAPDFGEALTFESAPFPSPTELSGSFSGLLRLSINKRDVDLSLTLYEKQPDGKLFHLGYYLGRASYAQDMTRRALLTPGEVTDFPFSRTRMTSRRMTAGSRLLLVVEVVKDGGHQVNHGSGKDVSDESAADAGAPLRLQLHAGSRIEVPLRTPVR